MSFESSSVPEAIGAKIRRLRKERKISQDRLSIEAHVDQSGLSKFERGGEREFAPQSLARIAKVLGLTLDQLTAGTDWAK
jgi:transcriptional regulator with XRE-family HTH domain